MFKLLQITHIFSLNIDNIMHQFIFCVKKNLKFITCKKVLLMF